MEGCWYSAAGEFKCNVPVNKGCKTCEGFSQPAWVDSQARDLANKERMIRGFPVDANEWEVKARESHGHFTHTAPSSAGPGVAACQMHRQEVAKVERSMPDKRAWCFPPP